MKPDSYSLIDLIRDDDFIGWVRNPTPESEDRWQHFLSRFPDKREIVEMAREYVNLIADDTGRDLPSRAQSNKMWRAVKGSTTPDHPDAPRQKPSEGDPKR